MKKKITVILCALAFFTFLFAVILDECRGEETVTDTMFESVTMDNEVQDISEVKVRRTRIKMESFEFTLAEIDGYIEFYEIKRKEIQGMIDEMRTLRQKVLDEAEKIRLRKPVGREG